VKQIPNYFYIRVPGHNGFWNDEGSETWAKENPIFVKVRMEVGNNVLHTRWEIRECAWERHETT